MRTTISRIQKNCMFIGAAFFGTLTVASGLLPVLADSHLQSRILRDPIYFAPLFCAWLCCLAYVMILGAWLGGTVSVVWRSPPGRHTYWTLSGGALIGTLALVGAIYLLGEPESSRKSMPVEMSLFFAVIFVGALVGLLLGHVIGRRLERATLVKLTS